MNWTGGRLSRHSRANQSSVRNKQKQHFARVRNSIPNGLPPKQSPVKWAIFDQIQNSNLLDNIPRVNGSGSSNTNIAQQTPAQQSPGLLSGKDQLERKVNLSTKNDHNTDDVDTSLRNATISHRGHKRKRQHDTPSFRLPDTESPPYQSGALQEMRQKLLREGDWVGINIQKPLHLKFSSQKEKETMGMRRHIHEQFPTHRIQHLREDPLLSREKKFNGLELQANGQHSRQSKAPMNSRNDVRIYIAGKEIRAGVSSTTTNKSRQMKSRTSPMQPTSSDVMLLDGDGRSMSFFDDHSTSTGSTGIRSTLPLAEGYAPRGIPINDELAFKSNIFPKSKIPRGKHGITNHASTLHGARQTDSSHSDHVFSLDHPRNVPSDKIQDLYYMHGALVEDNATRNKSNNSQATTSGINSSHASGISLHHPVPQTSRVSQILYSTSPMDREITEEADLTPAHHFDQSRSLDEEIWKSWIPSPLGSVNSSISVQHTEAPTFLAEVDSEVGKIASTHASPLISTALNGYRTISAGDNLEPRHTTRLADIKMTQNTGSLEFGQGLSEREVKVPKEDHKTLGPLPLSLTGLTGNTTAKTPRQDADPDAAWKKFVLAYDAEEEVDNFPLYKRPPLTALSTSDTMNMSLAPLRSSGESLRFSPSATQAISNSEAAEANVSSDSLPEVALKADSVMAQASTAVPSSPPLPKRRMIFTKPTAFRSSGSTSRITARERSPVYIGRRQGGQGVHGQRQREMFPNHNSEDEESIEDD